jgi:carbon-monoxide dehydrogenase large subunit
MLNRPEAGLRVIAPDVGGSFGVKDCIFPEDVLVPYLALRLGRPVKWVEERRENMLAYHGRGMTLDIEAAVRVMEFFLDACPCLADIGHFPDDLVRTI